MAPNSVDLVVTSPPYWNLKDYEQPDQIGASSYEDYLARLTSVWAACFAAAKDEGVMVIDIGNRRHQSASIRSRLTLRSDGADGSLWDIVIWYVPNALPQPNHYIERLFDNKFEFLLIFIKDEGLSYKFHKPRVPQKYVTADPRVTRRTHGAAASATSSAYPRIGRRT